jgi:hypothetical protein
MEKAEELSDRMAALDIYNSSQSQLTKHEVRSEIVKCGKMLGMFNLIFAQVQGVDAGLRPTEDQQTSMLATTIEKTSELWLGSGWLMDKPKWHLLFDGHLVDQRYVSFGDSPQ